MAVAIVIVLVIAVLAVLVLSASIKIAREYERGIVFRLGRLLPEPKGPGLFTRIPIVDQVIKVDLRTITLMIPPQEVITKDNVPVRVNAVAYFRIVDPKAAIVQVENFMVATSQIAQTTLRSVLGQHQLDELLSEREKINTSCRGSSTRRQRRGASRSRSSRSRTSRSRPTCSSRWPVRRRPRGSAARRSSMPRASSRRPSG